MRLLGLQPWRLGPLLLLRRHGVALAFAALGPPALLVADEPTGQLDRHAVDELPPSVEVGAPTHPTAAHWADRVLRVIRRMYPSDRLIGWGIVLLLVAAAVAGMVGVDVHVSTTGH